MNHNSRSWLIWMSIAAAIAGVIIGVTIVSAEKGSNLEAKNSPIHPAFTFLDTNGLNVLDSNQPVSTIETCGQCHDTKYIQNHSFHSDLGLSDIQQNKGGPGTSWNLSNGYFGKWDPQTYRYLSKVGDPLLDLTTPDWIMSYGSRMVGGGPGTTSRSGLPLTQLMPDSKNPETASLNPANGQITAWNWVKSGTLEMDCFLCHIPNPNNSARTAFLKEGEFKIANTATLLNTNIVSINDQKEITWNRAAFDENGNLLPTAMSIENPTNDNCGQCHGLVETANHNFTLDQTNTTNFETINTGQVISPALISESGINLVNKDSIKRPWDIHAERGLTCVDCHYSLNNPVTYQENTKTKPENLLFDPRRLDLSDYIKYPNHNIGVGQHTQYVSDTSLQGTMRTCDSCHDAQKIHADWLPYTKQHMSNLACETCHIPQLYAPAVESYDWTVLTTSKTAVKTMRGIEGNTSTNQDLVTGFQPVLMARKNFGGGTQIAPYNLVSSWYWVYEDGNSNTRPVRLSDLEKIYFSNGKYSADIIAAFDKDGNGTLSFDELRIDSSGKEKLVASKLESLGLKNVHIVGEIQTYSISHDVIGSGYAVGDCKVCHGADSQLSSVMKLSNYVPGGVLPTFSSDGTTIANGNLSINKESLFYQPNVGKENLYVFGYSRYGWVDLAGGIIFLAVLLGTLVHGGIRIILSLKGSKKHSQEKKVYMYQPYERFWHWLQTILILLLLCTGLIIHRPDLLGGFSFRGMVLVHNVSAAILALNAALSLFYHLASGEIRQFIPRPAGFFEDTIEQTKYYLSGIFKGKQHPLEKTPERKMNPLQQMTYLAILNVLLPLQGISGILMWGAQTWGKSVQIFGGIKNLAAFHTLIAWLFAAFIVLHVYLTTTGGPKPTDSITGMITGWETLETHADMGKKPILRKSKTEKKS